jgi:AGZA family xanthine/uracil permease-like MFS transporter
MMRQIVLVNWRYIGDALPAFVTVMFIPFGYSAAYGLIAGLMTYTALNGLVYLTKLVSGGRVVPDDEDHREYWTSKRPILSCIPLRAVLSRIEKSNYLTDMSEVKPQGKLPWFITASQRIASLAHGERGADSVHAKDDVSIRSGESGIVGEGGLSSPFREQTSAGKDSVRMQSKGSNCELDTVVVVPRDPGGEKVVRKM